MANDAVDERKYDMSEIEIPPEETLPEGLTRILKEAGSSHAEILDIALMMVWEQLRALDDVAPGPISKFYGFSTQQEAILETAKRLAGSAASLLGLLEQTDETSH